jgi:hypothetical protein
MQETVDDPPEFTDEQMRKALKDIGETVRREAFAAGLPVSFIRDGKIVLLYADGHEEIVEDVAAKNGTSKKLDR